MDTFARVTLYRDRLIVNGGCVNSDSPPPPRGSGSRGSLGLNRKQVAKIRRAVDSMEAVGPTWFVTLTYPPGLAPLRIRSDARGPWADIVNVVDDAQAKRHLSTWLKRLKRSHPGVRYVWVAEVQPERLRERLERAIHFHLVVSMDIRRDWLDTSWSEVIGSTSYPNIQRVRKTAGGYLAKYMSKGRPRREELDVWEYLDRYIQGNRCGIDQETSRLLKPQGIGWIENENWAQIASVFAPPGASARIGSAPQFFGLFWGFSPRETAKVPLSSLYEDSTSSIQRNA